MQERRDESRYILFSRRLFQQFVVDGYSMIESQRLDFIRFHQKELRCELYKGLADAVLRGETDLSTLGKCIVLPESFTGGRRNKAQNYQDAMAIYRWAGYPELFITITCNPKWPEIVRFIEKKRLRPKDRPDIVYRIFKMKLDRLIKDLRDNKVFGSVKVVVYTIEFQKRGLPHAHIVLFLCPEDKCPSPNEIDEIISAEIPDPISEPEYYEQVKNLMIHGPCGNLNKKISLHG